MQVFVTGATGYIGRRVVAALVARGHSVRALVRPGAEERLPAGVCPVVGDALRASTFAEGVRPGDTFVQLVGTPHPGPSKAREFERVDWGSLQESVAVARVREVAHFVYLSVAHPAPVMHAYIAVRTRGERLLRESALRTTVLRPWYVLGPGHRWPYLLLPLYWIAERVPATRSTARRLGLVTIRDMVSAIVHAVEHAPETLRVIDVAEIREAGRVQE